VKENSDFGFFENTSFLCLYKSVFESNLKYRKHLPNAQSVKAKKPSPSILHRSKI
jgi:hypothetical protein